MAGYNTKYPKYRISGHDITAQAPQNRFSAPHPCNSYLAAFVEVPHGKRLCFCSIRFSRYTRPISFQLARIRCRRSSSRPLFRIIAVQMFCVSECENVHQVPTEASNTAEKTRNLHSFALFANSYLCVKNGACRFKLYIILYTQNCALDRCMKIIALDKCM